MQETTISPSRIKAACPDPTIMIGAYVQGTDLVVKFGDLREAKIPLTTFDYEITDLKKLSTNSLSLFAGKINIMPKILDYLVTNGFFTVQTKLYKKIRESVVSNKEAKRLIRAGKVCVNDIKINDPNTLIKQLDYVEIKDS